MAGTLFLITGTDTARVAERSRALIRDIAGENPDAFALDTITERDEFTAQNALAEFIQAILTPPFLGGSKTVWLKHFSAFKDEKKKGSPGAMAGLFDRLIDVLAKGIPDGLAVVMSGPDVDKRKSLYKLCVKIGTVEVLDKPDIKSQDWRREMERLLQAGARAKGLRLKPEAVDHLISILGTDTAAIDSQLEKVWCYLGQDGTVSGELAQLLCQGDGETVYWGVTDAIGARDLNKLFAEIETVLALEKNPDGAILKMVYQVSGFFRQLLQAKILMMTLNVSARQVSGALKNLSPEKKKDLLDAGLEVVTIHPYRCQMISEQAERYGGGDLVDAVIHCRDVFQHCVGGGGSHRVALESMLAGAVGK
ncbi:MAG: hypothetical protein RRC34_04530 [Lentisphaeria bacterium]|nr:hypothetical protein [Lentisphaeria bacterium]